VEEQISTTLIPEGFAGTIDEYRNIILQSEEHRAGSQCGVSQVPLTN
jgi:hypothetical protein